MASLLGCPVAMCACTLLHDQARPKVSGKGLKRSPRSELSELERCAKERNSARDHRKIELAVLCLPEIWRLGFAGPAVVVGM